MRIGEIAEITGLSISNIRFYEKKGLIGPDREEESKYRNYTAEDLERLNQIILYRKMEMPVEVISQILNKEVSSEDAIRHQLLELEEKQKMLQGSIDLCNKLIDDNAFLDMDTDYYLNYVKEEEAKGKLFGSLDEMIEDFATMTDFDRFGLWMLPKYWMYKAAMVLWFLFIVFVPVLMLIDEYRDEGVIGPKPIAFAVVWIMIFGVMIITRRKSKN